MPTRRRYKRRASLAPDFELQRIHLELGDCLLPAGNGRACVCGLRRPDGTEDIEAIARAREVLGMNSHHRNERQVT